MPDVSALLAAYDAQVRGRVPDPLPRDVTVERDGPLLRFVGMAGGGFVVYRDLGGLDGGDLDELIARQVHVFAERGERFEWKLHGHDRPRDLPQRLRGGIRARGDGDDRDCAGRRNLRGAATARWRVAAGGDEPRRLRERIAALEQTVWGDLDGQLSLADMLESERSVDPGALTIVVAEAGSTVVCAGWIRFERDTEFATLWGGATHPEWRRRGIYRATVAFRANLAAGRGFRYLETDAADDSRPILERLGFIAVTTTTPYVWSPPTAPAGEP